MGTRARIGIVKPDGHIISIYTHWDGSPDHHAPILLGHWATPEKLSELLALGDLSTLAEQIGEKHDFESRDRRDWCKSYKRDRNEAGCEAQIHSGTTAFEQVAYDCDAKYVYLLRDGRWIFSETPGDDGPFKYADLKIPEPQPDTISNPY